jgi:hypothetical protein
VELSEARWRTDIGALLGAIGERIPERGRRARLLTRWAARIGAALLLLAALVLGARVGADRIGAWWSARRSVSEPNAPRTPADARESSGQTPSAPPFMPSAPAMRTIPRGVVGLAREQLARARTEFAPDAAAYAFEINCDAARHNICRVQLRFGSASRVASLDATLVHPDSAWQYRSRGGVNRDTPLSLEIQEFTAIERTVRAAGVVSDIAQARLEFARLGNGSAAERWTVWPKDRSQAGRDGRLCIEPRSAQRVDCRTGQ